MIAHVSRSKPDDYYYDSNPPRFIGRDLLKLGCGCFLLVIALPIVIIFCYIAFSLFLNGVGAY